MSNPPPGFTLASTDDGTGFLKASPELSFLITDRSGTERPTESEDAVSMTVFSHLLGEDTPVVSKVFPNLIVALLAVKLIEEAISLAEEERIYDKN